MSNGSRPTETATSAVGHRLTGTHPADRPVPLTPLHGIRGYVLDAALRPVPAGPRQSSTSRASAWRTATGARTYRTGALVRHGSSGALEFDQGKGARLPDRAR